MSPVWVTDLLVIIALLRWCASADRASGSGRCNFAGRVHRRVQGACYALLRRCGNRTIMYTDTTNP